MKRPILLAAVLWALLAVPSIQAQAPAPVSPDAYRQTIARALALVEEGDPHQTADLLTSISAVELPGGELVPVDHGEFAAALYAAELDLGAVSARLAALLAELEDWPAGPVPPDAFDRLAGVLARPEFQPQPEMDPNPLLEWLREIFDFLPDLADAPSWLLPLIVIVGLGILASIVAYFGAGLWGSFAAQADANGMAEGDGALTSGQALSRSREMAQVGDYRTAVRLLYLSTLLMLEERNLLRYDRALTNREYLIQVGDHPALSSALRPIVDTFDEVWYGQIEPDAGRYEDYAQQVDRVREVEE